jgi:hypothetical protein
LAASAERPASARTSLATTARRLDGRVQRQDVGLEGDAVDDADDVGDLARGGVDLAHGADHLPHDHAALLGDAAGRGGELVRLARVVGVLLHRGIELLHGGGRLLQRAGLLLGAAGQVVVARGNLRRGAGQALAAVADVRDDAGQLLLHGAERLQHLRGFVPAAHGNGLGQVAPGNGVRRHDGLPERARNAAHQRPGEQCRERQPADDGRDGGPADRGVARIGRFVGLAPFVELQLDECIDAAAHRFVEWSHAFHNGAVGACDVARAQRRHGGQQAFAHEARAVVGERLGQCQFLGGVVARQVAIPDGRDGGDVGVHGGGVGRYGGLVRRHQRHGQQQALAQQEGLDLADLGGGRQPLLVHGAQGAVGLHDAP